MLGDRAPEPFQRGSKKQAIVWDGKDDQGRYIDDKDKLVVRVSLGLKPRFERTLYWSPKKRIAPGHRPLMASAPEGVYVFEGGGVDHIRQFDHAGNYIRTVYPFPPDYSSEEARSGSPKSLQAALSKVIGLQWMEFPQDGRLMPVWHGIVQATLFTSGDNTGDRGLCKYGTAASAMALLPGRGAGEPGKLALVKRSLNRMATDGTTGGMSLEGPKTWVSMPGHEGKEAEVYPRSAAFSPDGKWVYLTGYCGSSWHWLPAVLRLEYLGNKEPELFAGSLKLGDEGNDERHFKCPMSVACDAKGRVYVADCMNDRIQVFDQDGKLLKSLAPVKMPVTINVHPTTGHIYVASWLLVTRHHTQENERVSPTLTHFGPMEDFRPIASYPLPFAGYHNGVFMNRTGGSQHRHHTQQVAQWFALFQLLVKRHRNLRPTKHYVGTVS
ncbi:MAG: hypothetical protein N3A38_16805, partial [Planctomycetota bacterium]|nr:hypothetical protein [Planctomycetota bacterium]